MVIERGAALEELKAKIPAQFKPLNDSKSLRAEFDASNEEALNAVHISNKVLEKKLQQMGEAELTNGDTDSALASGYHMLAAQAAKAKNGDTQQRKKKQDQELFNSILRLQAQLDRLYEEIEAIDKQIQVNNKVMEAIEEIQVLAAANEFDPENNFEHKKMLEYSGVTLEEYKLNAHSALAERIEELNAENERLALERENRVEQIQDIEQSADAESYYSTNQALKQNIEARLSQLEIQSNYDVQDKSELEKLQEKRETLQEVDEEVGNFMRAFEKGKQIENPEQRLMYEKDLVDKVSDEAKDNLSMESETEKLFEDGYFDKLNNQTITTLAPSTPSLKMPSI